MFIQLTALRATDYGSAKNGLVTIRKDGIDAVYSASAYNFDSTTGERRKIGYSRGSTIVQLSSGAKLHVEEKLAEVEAMLMA